LISAVTAHVAVAALAKLPDVHPVQVRSAVAVPAVKTWPVGQLAVQGVHDVAVPAPAT
jgi:hypothetical protein